jgi:hypothetical protein
MRWFKHLTRAHDDEKLGRLMDDFGAEGYGVYWIILERIAGEMDETDRTSLELSVRNWAKSCHISVRKWRNIAELLAKLGGFFLIQSGQRAEINCPNLLKFRDEYTEKSRHHKSKCLDKLPPDTDTETDTEIDTDKKKKKNEQPKIQFQDGHFINLTDEQMGYWTDHFPAVGVKIELMKMESWLQANPTQVKSNYKRFISNWLTRTQDRGGTRREAVKSINPAMDELMKWAKEKQAEEANHES